MNLVRWDTLLSDITSLMLVGLQQEGTRLRIVLEGEVTGERAEFTVVFVAFFAYRSLREEYRTTLWSSVPVGARLGWTRWVAESQWVAEMMSSEPLFVAHGGGDARHYLICTEDDVVEVLAIEAPVIEQVSR
jgi:hypothetical protein